MEDLQQENPSMDDLGIAPFFCGHLHLVDFKETSIYRKPPSISILKSILLFCRYVDTHTTYIHIYVGY
jgi:hypothetical protein